MTKYTTIAYWRLAKHYSRELLKWAQDYERADTLPDAILKAYQENTNHLLKLQLWASTHAHTQVQAAAFCQLMPVIGGYFLINVQPAEQRRKWAEDGLTSLKVHPNTEEVARYLQELLNETTPQRKISLLSTDLELTLSELLGIAFNHLGDLNSALEIHEYNYERFNAHNPDSFAVYIGGNYANVLMEQGEYQKAMLVLQEVISNAEQYQIFPINQFISMANLLRVVGQYKHAKTVYEAVLEHLYATDEQPLYLMRVLANLAKIHLNMDHYELTQRYASQALAMARSFGDMRLESDCINTITQVDYKLGNLSNALEGQRKVVALDRQTGDMSSLTVSLSNQGEILREMGDLAGALVDQKEALDLAERYSINSSIPNILGCIGNTQNNMGNYDIASDYYQKAIEHSADTPAEQLGWMLNLGLNHGIQQDFKNAIACFEQVLAAAKKIEITHFEAQALLNLGIIKMNMGELGEARGYMLRNLEIVQGLSNPRQMAVAYQSLATIEAHLGNVSGARTLLAQVQEVYPDYYTNQTIQSGIEALEELLSYLETQELPHSIYEEELQLYHLLTMQRFGELLHKLDDLEVRVPNVEPKVRLWRNYLRATVLRHYGHIKEAWQFIEPVLVNLDTLPVEEIKRGALLEAGIIQFVRGEIAAAQSRFDELLNRARAAADTRSEMYALDHLGIIYRNQGNYDRALEYFEASLAIARQVGDRNVENSELGNIGNVCINLKDYFAAIRYLKEAIEVAQLVSDGYHLANHLNNIGNAYREIWRLDKAEDYYNQALVAATKVSNDHLHITVLLNLGNTAMQQGNFHLAEGRMEKALKQAQHLGLTREKAQATMNLGVLKLTTNNTDAARSLLTDAMQQWELLGMQAHIQVVRQTLSTIPMRKAMGTPEQMLTMQERETINQLLQQVHQKGNKRDEALYLVQLATIAQSRNNDLNKAVEYLQQALQLFRATDDNINLWAVYMHLGKTYLQLGNLAAAAKIYEEALDFATQRAQNEYRGDALYNRARVYVRQKNDKNACDGYMQALAIYRALDLQDKIRRTQVALESLNC